MVRRNTLIAALVPLIAAGLLSRNAQGQATPLVAPAARVYRDLDRLAAMGLIDTLILGARPLSEREVVRRLTEAERNLSRAVSGSGWAERTIATDLALYRRDANRVIDAVTTEAVAINRPSRPVPGDANGVIDAWINPLAAYRGGRALWNGATVALETTHAALLGPHVAVVLNPRVTTATQGAIGGTTALTLQTGYVNTLIGGLSVQVGRDYTIFGPAPTGGLLLSTNAPAFDMVRVVNDRAWRVPLLSRLFGPMRGMLVVADLGTNRVTHPHTKLIAYHVAGLPSPHLELGVQVVDAMGGNGGEPATFGDRVLDAIPIVDAFRTKADFQFSNKLVGIDLRWRMPAWRGFEFYAEGAADDVDGRDLGRAFTEDAGYVAGASLTCLATCGRATLRAEYHQTGIRYYTHLEYPMASRGFLLGDPLGPRGVGGYLSGDLEVGRSQRLALVGAVEARSGNTYRSATTGAHEAGFHFELVDRRPSEKRGRLVATWTQGDDGPVAWLVRAGLERVWNFQFVAGSDRFNGLASIGLTVRP